MCCLRFTMSLSYRKAVERQLKTAQHLGKLHQVKYCLAILAVMDGQSCARYCQVNGKALPDAFPLRKAEGMRIAKIQGLVKVRNPF